MPTTDLRGFKDLAYALGRFAKLPPAAATARNHNAIRARPQRIGERRSDLLNDIIPETLKGIATVASGSTVFPDFLVSQYEPRSLGPDRGDNKSALVGDIKLKASNINTKRSQFRAMVKHADNFSYVPVMMYVTLFAATETKERRVQAAAGDVYVIIASLQQQRGKRRR